MIRFSHDKVLGAVIIDTRRLKGTDDKGRKTYPVKYRITSERKQTYYRSGYDLSTEDWINLETTKAHDLTRTRNLLIAGLKRIEDEVIYLINNSGFSLDALNTRLGRGQTDTLQNAFQVKVDYLKAEGRINSSYMYDNTLKKIREYSTSVKFTDVTTAWLKNFETFLVKQGRNRTTIAIYFRCIRSVINTYGNLNDNRYPFSRHRDDNKYKIKEGKGRKMALTLEQIKTLVTARLTNEKDIRARDLFFFSYLCNGANMADISRFRYDNINWQTKEIVWQRRKSINTNTIPKELHAVLLPQMTEIIKKYGNPQKEDNYIFPFLSPGLTPEDEERIIDKTISNIDYRLISIAHSCSLPHFSFGSARHSFATVLKRSGVSLPFISEQLGHSSLSVTAHYLDSFESAERQKNASKLTDFSE